MLPVLAFLLSIISSWFTIENGLNAHTEDLHINEHLPTSIGNNVKLIITPEIVDYIAERIEQMNVLGFALGVVQLVCRKVHKKCHV